MNISQSEYVSHAINHLNLNYDLTKRPRRNRKTNAIRNLIQETRLHPSHFVAPLFIVEGINQKQPILSMPGVFRFSLDQLMIEVSELIETGVHSVDLFTAIDPIKKTRNGLEAIKENNLLFNAIRLLKKNFPELCIMVDIALDPFTDHGHDGLVDEEGNILNDSTLEMLAKMSILAADAGADIVAPSDMMDGRVGYIRKHLDINGFSEVSILSYAVKYASSFYGPFRDALQSAPKFGNKKTYQMNPANRREAMLEIKLDEEEGADLLLIKPALTYLDVLVKAKEITNLPIGAYHVSGEYAMVMAAAEKGWINGEAVMLESLLSLKRAGADFILTYAAKNMAKLLMQ